MTAATAPRVTVEELKRAWAAVQDGQFRDHHRRPDPRCATARPADASAGTPSWTPHPTERLLPVLGCGGGCGATTVAFAVAEAAARAEQAGGRVRVVDGGPGSDSGLAAAGTLELGVDTAGWARAARSTITLHRRVQAAPGPDAVPPPPPASESTLTVIDLGWDLTQLLAAPGWLSEQLAPAAPTKLGPVVLVAAATVPGLRRLEGALALLPDSPTIAAVRGLRWSRVYRETAGPLTRRLAAARCLLPWPHVSRLAVAGLDVRPLPAAVRQAAAAVLTLADHHQNTTGGIR